MLAGVRCISTWLSHRLETVTVCLQGTFVNQATLGGFSSHFRISFPYFRFRTSVSVLRFPHFSVFHLPVYVPSLVSRELPDFSPLLWNEICEWPGNEASVYLFSSPRSTLSRGKTVWWTKLVSTCSCSSVTYSNIQKHFCSKRVKFYCCMEIAMTVILTTSLVLITFWE